jgi:hypothetical protein
MNKIQPTFLTIAILAATVFVVGAYSNPSTSNFDTAGNPKVGPTVVPVVTEGFSQVKLGGLGIRKTFFARGDAVFEDQVLLTGPLYGGKESGQIGDRILSVGAPGETSPTSVFAMNNVKVVGNSNRLQTLHPTVLPAGTTKTVPVCSDVDGFVVLCGEAPQDVCTNIEGPQDVVPPGMTEVGGICTTTPPPAPSVTLLGSVSFRTTTQVYSTIGGSGNRMNYLFNSNYYPDSQLTPITGNGALQEDFLLTQAVCRGVGPNVSPYAVTLSSLSSSAQPYGTNQPTKPFASVGDIIYSTGTTPLNGGNNWWALLYNSIERYAVKINSAGVVQSSIKCL